MKKSNLIKQLSQEINSIPVPDVLEKVRQKTPIIIATQTKPNSKYFLKIPLFNQ